WASTEQQEWLTKCLPVFVKAQQDNTIGTFLAVMYSEWFHLYELEDPTEEELQDANGDAEKAASIKTKEQRKRLRNWFYNHARGAPSRRVLNLTKKKTGYLHPYQAYLKV
ncbi:hypothetical protein FKP32DRAFT_1542788, partial [Trametes sanguinea]